MEKQVEYIDGEKYYTFSNKLATAKISEGKLNQTAFSYSTIAYQLKPLMEMFKEVAIKEEDLFIAFNLSGHRAYNENKVRNNETIYNNILSNHEIENLVKVEDLKELVKPLLEKGFYNSLIDFYNNMLSNFKALSLTSFETNLSFTQSEAKKGGAQYTKYNYYSQEYCESLILLKYPFHFLTENVIEILLNYAKIDKNKNKIELYKNPDILSFVFFVLFISDIRFLNNYLGEKSKPIIESILGCNYKLTFYEIGYINGILNISYPNYNNLTNKLNQQLQDLIKKEYDLKIEIYNEN